MTEPGLTTELDFNELAKLIAKELDSALRVSSLSKKWEQKLHIASVRVKLGQASPPSDQTSKTLGKEPPPFLLLERYPLAKQGWMFEMEFAAGPRPPQARGPNGLWFPLPFQRQPTAAALFSEMPTTVIKGIDRSWAVRLEKIGIATVSELMSISQTKLDELVSSTGSKYALELRFKARLLDAVIPEVPASPADSYSLSQLVSKSAEELRKLIGPHRFSSTASEALSMLLSMLYTTIDDRILARMTLQDVRTVSIGE